MGDGGRTLLDKIWDAHLVAAETDDDPGRPLRRPAPRPRGDVAAGLRRAARAGPARAAPRADGGDDGPRDPHARRGRTAAAPRPEGAAVEQVSALERNCREFGVTLYPVGDDRQGIVHVIGPELGLTHPGSTIVCGDSHTSTHGAFGALAFGIGTSEVGHVLATQCLLQRKPKALAVEFDGALRRGVTAKDLILALIARIGTGGATGHALEYRGPAIRALSMEERMTVCNMSIEAGARAGLVAPDETTYEYLAGRPAAPAGAGLGRGGRALARAAERRGRRLRPRGADRRVVPRADDHVGHEPRHGHPRARRRARARRRRRASRRRCATWASSRGSRSWAGRSTWSSSARCTNSRLSDLREAARVFRGRKVATGVRALVVPGSQAIKKQAEAEGLDRVFREAGAEWREAGCSMCLAMNDDRLAAGPVRGEHQQPQLRGPAGAGRADVPREPAHRGRVRRRRHRRRRPGAAVVTGTRRALSGRGALRSLRPAAAAVVSRPADPRPPDRGVSPDWRPR